MKKATSETILLDVNVLIALAWPNHQFHSIATRRLEQTECQWATCALTQLGFIRLSAMPAVVGVKRSPSQAAMLLETMVTDEQHLYIAELPTPVSPSARQGLDRILGHKQITDSYLVSLAEEEQLKLVTFDTRISLFASTPSRVEVLGLNSE